MSGLQSRLKKISSRLARDYRNVKERLRNVKKRLAVRIRYRGRIRATSVVFDGRFSDGQLEREVREAFEKANRVRLTPPVGTHDGWDVGTALPHLHQFVSPQSAGL